MKTLSAAVGLIAGVALLAALVVIGGLIALVALPAMSLARRVPRTVVATRRQDAAVLALEPAAAEFGLEALGRRAA